MLDPCLQDVADKILHDLPEELAATLSFKLHEGGDGLVLNYPEGLHGTPDMKLLDEVARRFHAGFVSRGAGKSFYLVPKPKPVNTVNAVHGVDTPKEESKPVEAPKLVDVKTAEPEAQSDKVTAEPELPQEQPNPPEQFKQPSPISIYRGKYCCACEDQGTCRLPGNAGQMQLCVRMLELQFLDGIAERLHKLGLVLEGLPKMPGSPNAPPTQAQPKPSQPQNQNKGSVEAWVGALKWEAAKTNGGKDCEKAYELQNLNGNLLKDEYVHLVDELKRRKAANEKNVIGGCLFFHTEQGENPYIGRMRAQGGRH
jgi:hypothetical protein